MSFTLFYFTYFCDVGVNQIFINYSTTELHLSSEVFTYFYEHVPTRKRAYGSQGTLSGGGGLQEAAAPPLNMSVLVYMYACAAHLCLVPTKARRGCWIPRNWSYSVCCLVTPENQTQVLNSLLQPFFVFLRHSQWPGICQIGEI